MWFFFIALAAHWSTILHRSSLAFSMTWYSFIFPNTALVTATFAIGRAFHAPEIQIVGCDMTGILILVWMFIFAMMLRAVVLKHISWPQKGEDKDEGGIQNKVRG